MPAVALSLRQHSIDSRSDIEAVEWCATGCQPGSPARSPPSHCAPKVTEHLRFA